MMSRNLLYIPGSFANRILTWSRYDNASSTCGEIQKDTRRIWGRTWESDIHRNRILIIVKLSIVSVWSERCGRVRSRSAPPAVNRRNYYIKIKLLWESFNTPCSQFEHQVALSGRTEHVKGAVSKTSSNQMCLVLAPPTHIYMTCLARGRVSAVATVSFC